MSKKRKIDDKCSKCGAYSVDHKRVMMCSSCYKEKRNKDWQENHTKRMTDSKYAKNRKSKQEKYIRAWKTNNRDRVNKNSLTWKQNNKEKVSELKKKWYNKNKDRIKEKDRERHLYKYNNDVIYKIKHNLRSRLNKAIKGNYKSGSAVKDLGCTIEELKKHLESQFQEGMTWNNWSKTGWHIDHIKPLASFNLEDREELLKACHYTNLQPLWAEDNLSKGIREDE